MAQLKKRRRGWLPFGKLVVGDSMFVALTQIPSEVFSLTQVTHLWLNNNQLTSLPTEIGSLVYLQRLSYNQIGAVPASIGNLTSLQYLESYEPLAHQSKLNDNQISEVPPALGNATSLQHLFLNNNQIEKLPSALGSLSSLQYLYLNNNMIKELPASLGNLSNLKYCRINEIPSTFVNLTNLQELNLSHNQLISLPSLFGNLKKLRYFYTRSYVTSTTTSQDLSHHQKLYYSSSKLPDDEMEEEVTLSHEGVLEKKGWMEWAHRYFRLVNSRLYFYKDKDVPLHSPSGIIDLSNCIEIVESLPVQRFHKEHCFMLQVVEAKTVVVSHYLVAASQEEKEEWLTYIKQIPRLDKATFEQNKQHEKSKKKDHSNKEVKKSPSTSPWMKHLVGKVASTGLGKKLIKDWISANTISFINQLKHIITKHGEDANLSIDPSEFEKLSFSVLTDVAMDITNKVIPKESLLLIRDPVFQLWSDAIDMLEITFMFDEDRLLMSLEDCYMAFINVIFPYFEFYTDTKWDSERQQLWKLLRFVWEDTFTQTDGHGHS